MAAAGLLYSGDFESPRAPFRTKSEKKPANFTTVPSESRAEESRGTVTSSAGAPGLSAVTRRVTVRALPSGMKLDWKKR